MPNGFFSVCVNFIYNCMVITIVHLFTVEKKKKKKKKTQLTVSVSMRLSD